MSQEPGDRRKAPSEGLWEVWQVPQRGFPRGKYAECIDGSEVRPDPALHWERYGKAH